MLNKTDIIPVLMLHLAYWESLICYLTTNLQWLKGKSLRSIFQTLLFFMLLLHPPLYELAPGLLEIPAHSHVSFLNSLTSGCSWISQPFFPISPNSRRANPGIQEREHQAGGCESSCNQSKNNILISPWNGKVTIDVVIGVFFIRFLLIYQWGKILSVVPLIELSVGNFYEKLQN